NDSSTLAPSVTFRPADRSNIFALTPIAPRIEHRQSTAGPERKIHSAAQSTMPRHLWLIAAAASSRHQCCALSTHRKSGAGAPLTRSNFIYSTASAIFVADMASASSPACAAEDHPRYLESEVQMKYGDGPDGNPRTRGVLVRRFTGDSTPYTFPTPRPVSLVKEWPEEPPFAKKDFFRADEGDDENFYTLPRLVYHIDEPAVAALTQYYRANIPAGSTILDICSSWVSHYPLEFKDTMKRISATGMNALELTANDQLTDYEARNLNVNPALPYDDDTFDAVTCVVSIDYLIHPIEVLKEVRSLS
ncbi:hypothetical protein ACHAWF_013462, partial [Thalassiosira exigua]